MKWMGTKPTECNICKRTLTNTFVDGKTTWGPNAIMCTACHGSFGLGFGTGQGQEYSLVTLEKLRG